MKKELKCAECGDVIEDFYYTIGDNFLQVKYFEEQDGSDNIFCSQDCICSNLSVECLEDDILAAEKLMDELNKVNDYIERLEKGE